MLECYAVTAPGLESITAAELKAQGLTPGRCERGGVAFEADASELCRVNLRLRTASRVLVRLATFRATAFHELEITRPESPLGDHPPARRSRIYVLRRGRRGSIVS